MWESIFVAEKVLQKLKRALIILYHIFSPVFTANSFSQKPCFLLLIFSFHISQFNVLVLG